MNDVKIFLILTLLVIAGCAEPPGKSIENKGELQSIVLQYHQYVDANKIPPSSVQDLAEFKDPYGSLPGNAESSARCAAALNSGNYVVIWSYNVAENLKKNSRLILAYHKVVPEQGGYVCFADGSAELMSKEQFEATELANSEP